MHRIPCKNNPGENHPQLFKLQKDIRSNQKQARFYLTGQTGEGHLSKQDFPGLI